MKNHSGSGGIGFLGLLTIVFIVLKLTHVINWSWWWVLSPALLSVLVFIVFAVAVGVVKSKIHKTTSKVLWRDLDDFR